MVNEELTVDEERTKRQVQRNERRDRIVLQDRFDVYNLVSKVHSPDVKKTLSRDYTLAGSLSPLIINGQIEKFIREQVKVLMIIEGFLKVRRSIIEKKYEKWRFVPLRDRNNKVIPGNKEKDDKLRKAKVDECMEAMQDGYENVRILLKSEMDTMVILSRAHEGRTLKSGLVSSIGREDEELNNEEKSITEKLVEKKGG